MDKEQKLLRGLGFSGNQGRIYLALVDKTESSISDIARATTLHRPTIYRELAGLESNGLVHEVRRNKRHMYTAAHPKILQVLHDSLSREYADALPDLESRYLKRKLYPVVRFVTGRKGIASVYEDILQTLKKGDTFYRYSSSSRARPRDRYVPKDYTERRNAKQLERYVITNTTNLKMKKPSLNRDIKIIPEEFDLFKHDITLLVYGPKIAYVDYSTESAAIIENPVIAEFQRKLFLLLYKYLPRPSDRRL